MRRWREVDVTGGTHRVLAADFHCLLKAADNRLRVISKLNFPSSWMILIPLSSSNVSNRRAVWGTASTSGEGPKDRNSGNCCKGKSESIFIHSITLTTSYFSFPVATKKCALMRRIPPFRRPAPAIIFDQMHVAGRFGHFTFPP